MSVMMTRKAKPLSAPRKTENVKRGSRLPYDVSYVGGVWPDSFELTQRELADLKKAFQRQPSNIIRRAYALGLFSYVVTTREYAMVTPAKVRARLKIVLRCGESLRKAMDDLETTDRTYIGSFFTRRFLKDLPCFSQNRLLSALNLFLADVGNALKELDAMQRRGAMPAFAERGLARTIALGLYLENNKFPPLTRGGVFDRVLKGALDACDKRLSRIRPHAKGRDVMELMRAAKENFDPQGAQQFGDVLSDIAT